MCAPVEEPLRSPTRVDGLSLGVLLRDANSFSNSTRFLSLQARETSRSITTVSFTELFGFITGLICVWLGVKEIPWTWPIGILNNAIYLVVFWRNGLYAIALLQIAYAAISLYGWWNWIRCGTEHSRLTVVRARTVDLVASSAVVTLLASGIFLLLRRFTTSEVPAWDAVTTALSLAAQFMMSKKWIQSWAVWLTVDVIYIALAAYKHLYLTSVLYLVFMALCLAGWVRWYRVLNEQNAQATTS